MSGRTMTRGVEVVESVAAIAVDNRQGAAQIAEQAADLMIRRAEASRSSSPQEFRRDLRDFGWSLIHAQPVMAPLVNLVNRVLWAIEEPQSLHDLIRTVVEVAEGFKHQLRQHALHVAEGALTLISDGITIVTLSYSTTVQHALRHAQRAGRRFRVVCGESRPILEGRQTAAILAEYGIPTRLVIDAELPAHIAQAQLVIVGADMLSTQGLVNKVGTYGMALTAHAKGVGFYALCGSEKFVLPGFRPLEQLDRPRSEIWAEAPPNVHIRNRYFDVTPLELLSGIVTERGVLPVAAIEAWLASTHLHPALAHEQQGQMVETS
jgi:translation initiation factor eIF-2B subunit delta